MASLYERSQILIQHLETRKSPASASVLMRDLGVSRATLFRIIRSARDQGFCIALDDVGYRLEPNDEGANQWRGFKPIELEAFLLLWEMLKQTQNEWLEQFTDLRSALLRHLIAIGIRIENWQERVLYLPQHRRKIPSGVFQRITQSLLHRKVIQVDFTDAKGGKTTRELSPQQIIRYRNGWSLDAFCHLRKAIRQFPLDSLSNIRATKTRWVEIPKHALEENLAGGYGLFAGQANAEATIRFTGQAARYIQREQWHPKQKIIVRPKGAIDLVIPYVTEHPEELIGDVLRWGAEAEVIKPKELREKISKIVMNVGKNYG